MSKLVALLAIGTEITSGQIVDTNSSWVANEMVNMGYDVYCHFSVPDKKEDILQALEFCKKNADLTIITGGLGPTSDDITREAVAHFTQKSLQYNEKSWSKIIDHMAQIGITAAESNRKQCYFPQGSTIIENFKGTANGFMTAADSHQIFCLPGPPRENQHLFKKDLTSYFTQLNSDYDQIKLYRWHILGKSEADLAEIVDKTIAGSKLIAGYRPHMPYVEIKIWSHQTQADQNSRVLEALDEQLRPFTVIKDDGDIVFNLLSQLKQFKKVHFVDYATQGLLQQRLRQGIITSGQKSVPMIHVETLSYHNGPIEQNLTPPPKNEFRGRISQPQNELKWMVHWQFNAKRIERTLEFPFPKIRDYGRFAAYIAEISLIDLQKILESPPC